MNNPPLVTSNPATTLTPHHATRPHRKTTRHKLAYTTPPLATRNLPLCGITKLKGITVTKLTGELVCRTTLQPLVDTIDPTHQKHAGCDKWWKDLKECRCKH